MSPRTVTLPPTEPAMWRKLLAKVHPDSGGDHELFIWSMALREAVCENGFAAWTSRRAEQERAEDPDTIPFDPDAPFTVLTNRALTLSDEVAPLYGELLRLLEDCGEAYSGTLRRQQEKGATYKQLAAIGHAVGMHKGQRVVWYRLCESIPLSRRHAGHMLGRLKGG